jgi:DNA-binding transcriptional MocR family regulator
VATQPELRKGARASSRLNETGLSLSDRAYRQIREEILSGDLSIGDLLSRRRLAERLNMSFLPITEALKCLETEGLVESRPGSERGYAYLTSRTSATLMSSGRLWNRRRQDYVRRTSVRKRNSSFEPVRDIWTSYKRCACWDLRTRSYLPHGISYANCRTEPLSGPAPRNRERTGSSLQRAL